MEELRETIAKIIEGPPESCCDCEQENCLQDDCRALTELSRKSVTAFKEYLRGMENNKQCFEDCLIQEHERVAWNKAINQAIEGLGEG